MEILFMVFMVVVSIMALFAVMVVFRDIVQEVLASRRERDKQSADILAHAERIIAEAEARTAASATTTTEAVPVTTEAAATETVAEETVTIEEVTEEPVVTETDAETVTETASEETTEATEEETDTEGTISFSMGQQQTLEEKYLALPLEQRRWYDEIIKCASAVEGSKRFKNARYEEYKVGKNRLVRLLIKRGIIHCEFILHNSDFKNYISENKISVRQSATTMLVESAATVDAVKNSIDIVVAAIAEEREYKKKLARERRRARGASETPTETAEAKPETPAHV